MLDETDAKCPLCSTILGQDAKVHIQAEYESEGKNLANKFRGNQATIDELKTLVENITSSLKRETPRIEQIGKSIYAQIANLEQQIEEAKRAPKQLENIRKELESLGYDPEKHHAIKLETQRLGEITEQYRQLQEALHNLPQEIENLDRVAELLERREQFRSQVQSKIGLIKNETESLPRLEQEYAELEARRTSLEGIHQSLVKEITILSSLLKQYENTETSIQLKSTEMKKMVAQQEIYDQLSTAFGRTGVQALLLESALPELEAEANRLLGRMTDNTMHLKLETQKQNQKGEQLETLEINVADTLGTRSYEMFSGGEAFRINLALRIALSKILANRSGAPLPTLFIDEGFGTQDSSGRERILDTLQSISEDFKRIIVITHLDEMKESFPVRIEVEKTESGATFTIT
jgi:exonuclease SbcC